MTHCVGVWGEIDISIFLTCFHLMTKCVGVWAESDKTDVCHDYLEKCHAAMFSGKS